MFGLRLNIESTAAPRLISYFSQFYNPHLIVSFHPRTPVFNDLNHFVAIYWLLADVADLAYVLLRSRERRMCVESTMSLNER